MHEFEFISEFPVPPVKLFILLMTPAFQEAMALRFGALEVSANEIGRTAEVVKMKIELLDSGWGLMGAVIKGKPLRATMLYDWNMSDMTGNWNRYFIDHGRNVEIEGLIRVEAMGDEACRMTESGRVEIKLPLVGKGIEKKLAKKLEDIQPKRVDFILNRLEIKT
ncbi:MAG TPA: DUF2505 family protein [Myxococcota bacterium]|nr:DUF2505 family protein [Myxococcota bacterium]